VATLFFATEATYSVATIVVAPEHLSLEATYFMSPLIVVTKSKIITPDETKNLAPNI